MTTGCDHQDAAVPRSRALLVGAAGTACAVAVVLMAAPSLAVLPRRAPAGAAGRGWWAALDASPPADLLAAAAAAVLLGCTGWLWSATLATLVRVATVAGPGSPCRGVPAVVHRAVLAACGLALAGGTLSPAGAVPTPVHQEPRQVPLRGAGSTAAPTPAPRHEPAATWTVQRGDTLWAIARAGLATEPGAAAPSQRDVAARVRVLHRLNRDAVPDPDLIHPAQRLRLPSA